MMTYKTDVGFSPLPSLPPSLPPPTPLAVSQGVASNELRANAVGSGEIPTPCAPKSPSLPQGVRACPAERCSGTTLRERSRGCCAVAARHAAPQGRAALRPHGRRVCGSGLQSPQGDRTEGVSAAIRGCGGWRARASGNSPGYMHLTLSGRRPDVTHAQASTAGLEREGCGPLPPRKFWWAGARLVSTADQQLRKVLRPPTKHIHCSYIMGRAD